MQGFRGLGFRSGQQKREADVLTARSAFSDRSLKEGCLLHRSIYACKENEDLQTNTYPIKQRMAEMSCIWMHVVRDLNCKRLASRFPISVRAPQVLESAFYVAYLHVASCLSHHPHRRPFHIHSFQCPHQQWLLGTSLESNSKSL